MDLVYLAFTLSLFALMWGFIPLAEQLQMEPVEPSQAPDPIASPDA